MYDNFFWFFFLTPSVWGEFGIRITFFRILTTFLLRYPTLAYREPLLYNLSVGRELLKQVYIAERLQPPTSWSTISHAYSTLWSRAANPAYWREVARSGEWQKIGIYALEAYGVFKVRLSPYLLSNCS